MPTYSYRCVACGHQFDQFQKIVEDPLTDCPTCGDTIRRVIQPVGIVFKGSGWYINDSRKPSPSENGAASDVKSAKGGDKSEKSTEKSDKPAKSGESTPSAEKATTPAAV